jgi:hypothetical protein
MMRWMYDLWYARQRKIDLAVLWPICCKHAKDIDHAKAAFAAHAFNDPAWLRLGKGEVAQRINKLEAP